ncbi:MAG: DUF4301 family protein [Nitrospirota bacterium]|nr:DUF4301 family protein [Nitrospirota bacterium]
MVSLSQNDHLTLKQRGISTAQVEAQLHQLRQGVPPIHLVRTCGLGDGILQLSPEHCTEYHRQFQMAHAEGRVSKFIPASGAATRMFKDLLQFLETCPATPTTMLKDGNPPAPILEAWKQLHHFPFIDALRQYFELADIDFQHLYETGQLAQVFHALVQTPGLDYANLPKALLPFHRYPEGIRTSLEEHVREAMWYGKKTFGLVRIHLTVSAQFETQVKAALEKVQQQELQRGNELELTVSIQKSSTDTIALNAQGEPFRDNEGLLVFRPGGHGALLENLNDYQGDIVFISNIDNVVPDHLKDLIVEWRMTLGGYLLEVQDKIFHLLHQLELGQPTLIEEVEAFVHRHLHDQFPQSYDRLTSQQKAIQLKQFLNRPLRVCGVVPNTGDPGGGPFWVQQADGSQSRQIIEQSQVDPESKSQQELFASATHFNPVDIVCGVRNYQRKPFNLMTFSDPNTSFISHKSYQGRDLKALEWPGLWNGGMANWITLFVEIPRATFNPVKTFLDWLHPNHQPPA